MKAFRQAIYNIPTICDLNSEQNEKILSSIPFCLQRIFYKLQTFDPQDH